MILIYLGLTVLVVAFLGVVFVGAPYVPSQKRDLSAAFDELYQLGPKDFVVDIGSGDGVVLREAAKRGASGVGYEINPFLVLAAWWLSRKNRQVTFKWANFWNAKFPSQTTLVYTFGDSRDIKRMAQKVENEATRLGKPLYFISYGVAAGERKPLLKRGAHYLYLLNPLQP